MVEQKIKIDAVDESNEDYRLIVENANEAILVEQVGVLVFSNPKAEALFGYSRAELNSKRFTDLVHKADRKMVREGQEKMLRGEPLPDFFTFRICRNSGEINWADLKVVMIPWKNRPAVLYCMTDITERNRVETVLAASERKLFNILVNTPQMVITLDPQARIVFVNTHFIRLTGWREIDVIGQNWFDLFIPEHDREVIQKIFYVSMQQPEETEYTYYENKIETKSGEFRQIAWSNVRSLDAKGKVVDLTCFGIDITEQKLAEESVLESEKRFRAAFMGSPAALAITTQEGGFWIDANQTELDMFGYTREELIGKSVMDTNLWVDLNDRRAFVDALAQNGEVRNQNVLLRHKDGRLISASVSANSLTLKGVKHILFATEDITERMQTEERIKQNLAEKEILLREIHHRVKNNLAVISSLLGLQANRIKENAVKEMMNACQLRIKSMAMVHEKMYCNQNVSRVNFNEYINSIVQDLTSSYRREKRNIITRINVGDILLDIEAATPCGMIINELITNALKHAFPETISPELFICFEKAHNTYTLTVQDNGIGFSDGSCASSTNTLGLLLVRALARQLRGTVQFHSDASVRQGTTVIISFKESEERQIGNLSN